MSEPFLGEIRMVGFDFAQRGWALCDGSLLQISQYSALFSILGTTYGGDGETNFGLPDLRGRAPVHPGSGPGLDSISLGQKSGEERHTLTQGEMPNHTHSPQGSALQATSTNPAGNVLASRPRRGVRAFTTPASLTPLNNAGQATGGGQAHNNMQPSLVVNFQIALEGIFPSRN